MYSHTQVALITVVESGNLLMHLRRIFCLRSDGLLQHSLVASPEDPVINTERNRISSESQERKLLGNGRYSLSNVFVSSTRFAVITSLHQGIGVHKGVECWIMASGFLFSNSKIARIE